VSLSMRPRRCSSIAFWILIGATRRSEVLSRPATPVATPTLTERSSGITSGLIFNSLVLQPNPNNNSKGGLPRGIGRGEPKV
jgi:hypothetical protein